MLKQILNIFNEEASNCQTKQELNGYFYASYDMLFVMVSNNCISQCAYQYLLNRMEKIKGVLMYRKFKNINYLLRLEKAGRL